VSSEVRVRFAPSPTGHLHIGGARTALFNWLFARHEGGRFVLRIEDTDRDRSTDEYIASIMEGMTWLGLDWDEGPHRQTERFGIYASYIEKLLSAGQAYHCYCTPEELEERRAEAQANGLTLAYDRRCRDLKEPPPGRTPAVRFRMPLDGITIVPDLIKGNITFENAQLDDLIIARSDGSPTYNFCVVVDDVDMGITHVIRGDDHLGNTPKQIQIYRAMGYSIPTFGHLPMILGADKTRLSKRHGATSVTSYRDEGYLPQALVNYLVRLGWSSGDQEVFSRDELIRLFSFENVGKSAAVFNPEKLLWLNAEYIKASPPEALIDPVLPFLIADGTVAGGAVLDRPWLARAIATLLERARTLRELATSLRYYIAEDVAIDPEAAAKHLTPATAPYLRGVAEEIKTVEPFEHDAIEAAFHRVAGAHEAKLGKVAQPVRVALTGGTASPGIFDVIAIVGRERVLARIGRAIAVAESSPS
jgi:glutamyl-tRNA synthetase